MEYVMEEQRVSVTELDVIQVLSLFSPGFLTYMSSPFGQ